jgi:hypothetical protein
MTTPIDHRTGATSTPARHRSRAHHNALHLASEELDEEARALVISIDHR